MPANDARWYQDAVIYELHVRAFCDSVGDGVGDFRGLTQKLDYLQDLGVTAIWLLPFYPSPLRDDGYDIADYSSIHPDYGNLETFQEFLNAAHARGLRVITELVINHTSDQHPWFQRARRAPPGSNAREFYVWSDTPDKYKETRVIFKDFEASNWSYDNVAKAYYWHRFYSHQPDLNFDNPAVWEALFPLVDFWFGMGVDGMRLDAVPYLYEREGTNCENLPETHSFLKALRKHVDERFEGRMLLAEANQWPEDAVAYFGEGDECHMSFHFPLMPRMFMAIHSEDRFPVVDIMNQTPTLPDGCQWALFLRNHDELTLEMVTDEERDYMYRAYALEPRARVNLGIRRRLAPLLGNNRRRMELMNGLLFSLPGTPVLYYGDEIGMGDNIYLGDRNGVRTPMQWSADRNAGFSRSNPQKLYLPIIIDPEYHYESINVEAQQANSSSLLWWVKRLISLRKQFQAFSRGSLHFLSPSNRRILAFLRKHERETLLVVANLSRFVQYVELDLSELAGGIPTEVFGSTAFPPIGRSPYLLTIGPHSFYWFSISQPGVETKSSSVTPVTNVVAKAHVPESWERLLADGSTASLDFALLSYLRRLRSPRRLQDDVRGVEIQDSCQIAVGEQAVAHVLLASVEYRYGHPDMMLIPLMFVNQSMGVQVAERTPEAIVANVLGAAEGMLVDATVLPEFDNALLQFIASDGILRGTGGGTISSNRFLSDHLDLSNMTTVAPERVGGELANTSISWSKNLILKLFRYVEEGPHPEVEIGRHLAELNGAPGKPRLLAELVYHRRRGQSWTLGVLHEFLPNEGDAWNYTLGEISACYEQVIALPEAERAAVAVDLLQPDQAAAKDGDMCCVSGYLETARMLGHRLADLHALLADEVKTPSFAREPFSQQYQRSIYQSLRTLLSDAFYRLKYSLPNIPEPCRVKAEELFAAENLLHSRLRRLLRVPLHSYRIRCHGDCDLAQILYVGNDFVFIDFEGSPLQSLGERRIKRSPIRDVVSMMRSFDYVSLCSLYGLASGRGRPVGVIRKEDFPLLESWTHSWRTAVKAKFSESYREHAQTLSLGKYSQAEWEILLDVFTFEKMLMELLYELDYRPSWLFIPLMGLCDALRPQSSPSPEAVS